MMNLASDHQTKLIRLRNNQLFMTTDNGLDKFFCIVVIHNVLESKNRLPQKNTIHNSFTKETFPSSRIKIM